jgi:hypothetical protein
MAPTLASVVFTLVAGGMDITTLQKPKGVPPGYAHQHSDPSYYRFNVQGMAAMRNLMDVAGALSTEAPPQFPKAPKAADPTQQALYDEVLQGGTGSASARKKLSASQLKTLDEYIAAVRQAQGARSAAADKVPSFKFESNEGWLVTPDECKLIAKALRAYAVKLSGSEAKTANAAAKKADEKLAAQVVDKQMVRLTEEVGMSAEEMKSWMLDWAEYNQLASTAGGYEVD